jgi:hypothetical protein
MVTRRFFLRESHRGPALHQPIGPGISRRHGIGPEKSDDRGQEFKVGFGPVIRPMENAVLSTPIGSTTCQCRSFKSASKKAECCRNSPSRWSAHTLHLATN